MSLAALIWQIHLHSSDIHVCQGETDTWRLEEGGGGSEGREGGEGGVDELS